MSNKGLQESLNMTLQNWIHGSFCQWKWHRCWCVTGFFGGPSYPPSMSLCECVSAASFIVRQTKLRAWCFLYWWSTWVWYLRALSHRLRCFVACCRCHTWPWLCNWPDGAQTAGIWSTEVVLPCKSCYPSLWSFQLGMIVLGPQNYGFFVELLHRLGDRRYLSYVNIKCTCMCLIFKCIYWKLIVCWSDFYGSD